MDAESLAGMLSGGDRRSPGRADELAGLLAADPLLTSLVVELLGGGDPLLRMRAADALEKASRANPEILPPHKTALLDVMTGTGQQEVQWHLLQMVPRLPLTEVEHASVFEHAEAALHHFGRIVVAEALAAMFLLSESRPGFRLRAVKAARNALETASPAQRRPKRGGYSG